MAGLGTLSEVRLQWRIEDIADAWELLDAKEEAERRAHAQARAKDW
jgi:hypothetical protein